MAFLFSGVDTLRNFKGGPYEEYFDNYFEFGPVIQEEIPFKDFSCGGHFVQLSGTILGISKEGTMKHLSEII